MLLGRLFNPGVDYTVFRNSAILSSVTNMLLYNFQLIIFSLKILNFIFAFNDINPT